MKNYRRAGLNEGEQQAAFVIANQNTVVAAKSEVVATELTAIKAMLGQFVKPKDEPEFIKRPLREN